jgi:hypothetical protein
MGCKIGKSKKRKIIVKTKCEVIHQGTRKPRRKESHAKDAKVAKGGAFSDVSEDQSSGTPILR